MYLIKYGLYYGRRFLTNPWFKRQGYTKTHALNFIPSMQLKSSL